MKIDWGTSNPNGYLATSVPIRARLLWGMTQSVVLAVAPWWFYGTSLAGVLFTFVGATVFFVLMAAAADLAAWRAIDGIAIAGLSGAGSGAIWWAMLRPVGCSVWVPIATGIMVGLFAIFLYHDAFRRLSNSKDPHVDRSRV